QAVSAVPAGARDIACAACRSDVAALRQRRALSELRCQNKPALSLPRPRRRWVGGCDLAWPWSKEWSSTSKHYLTLRGRADTFARAFILPFRLAYRRRCPRRILRKWRRYCP